MIPGSSSAYGVTSDTWRNSSDLYFYFTHCTVEAWLLSLLRLLRPEILHHYISNLPRSASSLLPFLPPLTTPTTCAFGPRDGQQSLSFHVFLVYPSLLHWFSEVAQATYVIDPLQFSLMPVFLHSAETQQDQLKISPYNFLIPGFSALCGGQISPYCDWYLCRQLGLQHSSYIFPSYSLNLCSKHSPCS